MISSEHIFELLKLFWFLPQDSDYVPMISYWFAA